MLNTRKYLLRRYILGLLTHTIAWDQHWEGDEALKCCVIEMQHYYIKAGWNKMRHVQKLVVSKKSTFFVLSSWNLLKITILLGNHFHQILWGQYKKCGFFTYGPFFNVSHFFLPKLYYIKRISSSQHKSFMILRKSSIDICDTTFAQNILRLHTPYIYSTG